MNPAGSRSGWASGAHGRRRDPGAGSIAAFRGGRRIRGRPLQPGADGNSGPPVNRKGDEGAWSSPLRDRIVARGSGTVGSRAWRTWDADWSPSVALTRNIAPRRAVRWREALYLLPPDRAAGTTLQEAGALGSHCSVQAIC